VLRFPSVAMTDLEFVNALREWEMARLLDKHRSLFAGKDLLEIGSGADAQLRTLRQICRSAVGIESFYRDDRLTEVVDYDGCHIPFADASFDVLFSSHTLEHISQQAVLHEEMHRVLRPKGIAVHIVPSASWRIRASVGHYPRLIKLLAKSRPEQSQAPTSSSNSGSANGGRWRSRLSYALIQRRHGEHGTWFSEHLLFRKSAWRSRLEARRRLAALVGASSFLLVTEPLREANH
jgi:SAM-dependent methyltransferase